ncbi:MAG: DNA/RNA non-specific endonuclease [Clostridia bacterium]|nr:DNA/RNA non-specific endonuclease [Clostridia bacterium]
MKSKKRILLSLITTLLLLIAVCTVGFAKDTDGSVEIVSQNLYYGDTIKMMYAVDAPEGADVSLKVYSDEACTNLICEATPGEEGVDYGTDKAVFFGPGVPAQKIDTVLYAKAYSNGSESAPKRYSVLEYLYERLYLGAPSEDQENLYKGLIDYAHNAQKVLVDDGFTPIKDYAYVSISGGVAPDNFDTGLYSGTIELTPTVSASEGCYIKCTVNGTVKSLSGGKCTLSLTGGEYYNVAFAEVMSEGGIVINGESVPYYSGEASYYILNGNKPYFEDSELKREAWLQYSPLDELGRATGAFACVCSGTVPSDDRESISHITPSGWVQASYSGVVNSLYNRTHLLAHMYMSDDVHVENFVTGTSHMNQSTMLGFENQVNSAVKNGDYVMYRVTPVYEGNNLVCTGLILEAYSTSDNGEDVEFCVFIYNVQPGVEIDYLTGESKLGDPTKKHSSNTGVVFVVGEGAIGGGGDQPTVCEHSYMYIDNEDGKTHTVSCKNCTYTESENHNVEDGSCVCGYTESSGSEGTEPVTVEKTISELATANGWENGVQYSSFSLDSDSIITITASTKGNNGKYYTSGTNWRLYQSDSGSFTISASGGKTIVSVKITYSSSNNGILLNGSTKVASGSEVTVNAESITFSVGNTGSATNGQARVTAIEVVYK